MAVVPVGPCPRVQPTSGLSDETYIDRTTFLTRANGLVHWLNERLAAAPATPKTESRAFANAHISGGNVNFGDGSSINVTNVTVMDVLRALERHIQSTVAEPAVKKSVLAKVGDLLRHRPRRRLRPARA